MIKKKQLKAREPEFHKKNKCNKMLWEKSKEEYIYIYIRGQQLKEKINRKTTINLGLPSSYFKKRREKKRGREKISSTPNHHELYNMHHNYTSIAHSK
jgi:hypothetical protein